MRISKLAPELWPLIPQKEKIGKQGAKLID
jgi:hypothetical protein